MSEHEQSTETTLDHWQAFSYLTVDKADIYRAIVDLFATAKSEFILHLRPIEIQTQLRQRGMQIELAELESALAQLESWGNLQSYKDNADVASLKDFYRKKLLYQLSASGEAAHLATQTFTQRLGEQARLDARALERIAEASAQLGRLAREEQLDGPKVLTTLRNICQDADDLTQRAQSFFRWIHEQTEAEQAELTSFLHYKEQLIEYLQHFLGELIARGGEIAARIASIPDEAYARLASVAAEEELGPPALGEAEVHQAALDSAQRAWLGRLLGLHGWFVGRDGRPPQSEQLRAAARAAIPRLLMIASQINERRASRSNRQADLRRLALWFASAADDAAAHRLFRAAFASSPARHLRVDEATLEARDQEEAGDFLSWLEASPITIAPQLLKTGRQPAGSASRRIVDRSAERAQVRRRLSMESSRESSARETLIALGRRRLSEVGHLDPDAFRLLLELLELAVSKPGSTRAMTTRSRDGSVQITVDCVHDLPRVAVLATEAGSLRTADLWLEVARAS